MRRFLLMMAIVMMLSVITGCMNKESGTGKGGEVVKLKLAHQWAAPNGDEGDYRSVLSEKFAEEVKKATNGEVEISVYPSNSLISPEEQFSSLKNGSVDLALWPPFYEAGKVPELSITLMPGIIQNFDQAWDWSNQPVGDEFNRILEDNGVRNLVWAWTTFGIGTKGKTEVINPKDVSSLLFRGAGKDSEKLLESQGAGIVSMPSSEIYGALQTNVIDGAFTSFDSFLSYRLYEVLDHFNYTGNHAFMFSMNPLVISDKTWNDKLSKEQQEIIMQVSEELQSWVKQAAIDSNIETAEIFRENGVNVHEMTEDEAAEWFEISQPVVEDFASQSDDAKKLIELARDLHK